MSRTSSKTATAWLKASSLSGVWASRYRTSSSRTQRGCTMESRINWRSSTDNEGSSAQARHASRHVRMEEALLARKDSPSNSAVFLFFSRRRAASRAFRKAGTVQFNFPDASWCQDNPGTRLPEAPVPAPGKWRRLLPQGPRPSEYHSPASPAARAALFPQAGTLFP